MIHHGSNHVNLFVTSGVVVHMNFMFLLWFTAHNSLSHTKEIRNFVFIWFGQLTIEIIHLLDRFFIHCAAIMLVSPKSFVFLFSCWSIIGTDTGLGNSICGNMTHSNTHQDQSGLMAFNTIKINIRHYMLCMLAYLSIIFELLAYLILWSFSIDKSNSKEPLCL